MRHSASLATPSPRVGAWCSQQLTSAVDWVMDKSLVLGYTKIGPAVRRAWWPARPGAGGPRRPPRPRHRCQRRAGPGHGSRPGPARRRGPPHRPRRIAPRHGRGRPCSPSSRAPTVETHVSDVSDLAATAEFARDLAARGAAPARRRAQRRRHAAAAHDDARGARARPRDARPRPARAHLRPSRVARGRRPRRARDLRWRLRAAPGGRRPGVHAGHLLGDGGIRPHEADAARADPAVGARAGRRRHHASPRCTPGGPTRRG